MTALAERPKQRQPPSPPNPWEEPKGVMGVLTTISNQELGKLFMLTAVIFFLLAGLMALLMRTQLIVPQNTLIGPKVYNELFTMHGSSMMYLVVVPFLEGAGIYFLPMLLGSRDVAYPYVTAFSYWTYLLGGLGFYGSFLVGSIPSVGWFAYTPLANQGYSGTGTDFWSLALTLVSVGDLAAGMGLTVSVLKLRAPGMSINRMPLFAWAWLVTGVMIAFAFTTLFTITTLMLPVDRALGTHFFDPQKGGSTLLWQHLFWFFGHPEVYIMFIPATGIISSVIPVFARRPMVAYHLVAIAIVMTAFVSFGLWVHHMFATGLPWLAMSFFTAASLMIALASGVQVFSWIATLWGTRPSFRVPLLYMLGFLSLFVLGGITGVMVAIVPFDWQAHDTYFLVAHFHYVLIGGVVFPTLGGVYYWWPKITGRMPDEKMGKGSFWITFLGFNLAFFPMHLSGLQGMPRRVYTYPAGLGLGVYNLLSTLGAYVLAAGFLLYLFNVIRSLRSGLPAGRNPWGGDTLEWALESPPPDDNFRTPPIVHSRHPLWTEPGTDVGEPALMRVRKAIADTPRGWRIALVTSVLEGKPEALQPWPRPSLKPLAASVGLAVLLIGTIAKSGLMIGGGAVVALLAFFVWYRPDDELLQTLRDSGLEEKSGLPLVTTGPSSMDWWGLLACLTIFSTVYGNLIYSYFYIRLYSPLWPQDHLPRPDLVLSGALFGLLLVSAVPQYLAMQSFRAERAGGVKGWLAAAFLAGLTFAALDVYFLAHQSFQPQTNAYGSLFYMLNWLLLATVSTGLVANGVAQRRVWKSGTDKKGYAILQVERSTLFWYYTVVIGVVIWGVVYLSPHL